MNMLFRAFWQTDEKKLHGVCWSRGMLRSMKNNIRNVFFMKCKLIVCKMLSIASIDELCQF